ncbi:sporulation protein YlmC with PRC-barrel domain [Bacillus mesophilus]|uniref:Uncharacterized protein n=1 Tax=Bacillus mesophilus TaxID=1808955 RepID=A0A6M0QD88_9BACI|nr:hypothetical protein [Bacillus mesophilus]MBM7663517.1 sporulation protein YlmC with PRC-barrel domain [Bacillus mesophilus]NEY74235.1 hypothetical protein [Bacillus mesophilus]
MKKLKVISYLLITLSLAACGTATDSVGQVEDVETVNGSEGSTAPEVTKEFITEEAAYVGQVDSNSIEVNTESQTITLLTGEVNGIEWNSIDKNAHVVIEYYKNENDQYVLNDITITKSEVKEDDQEEEKSPELIKEEAAYVGQVDSHSIEVNTENKTITLLTNQVTDVNWSSIKKNTHIVIEYYKNNDNQYVLTNLSVTKSEKEDKTTSKTIREEAAYVGQVDSNSIEVNTEFKTMTLQLGDEVKDVKWNTIEKNAHVIIEYHQNDEGQYILTKIEVK